MRLALSPLSIRLCLSLIFFIDLQGQPTSFPSSLGLQIGLPFHPRQTLEAPLPTNDIPFSPSIIPFSFSLSTTNHQIRRPALPCVPDLISSSFLTHSPLLPRLLFLLPDRTQWNIAKRDDSRRQSTRWLEPNLLLSKASFDPIIANSFFLSVALRLTASSLPNNSALYNPRIWWGFKRLEREREREKS